MNRRSFLKTLLGTAAVVAVPSLVTARTLDDAEVLSTRSYFPGGWHAGRDDSVWIQAALDRAARDGSTVYLHDGEYELKHPIHVPAPKGQTVLVMEGCYLTWTGAPGRATMLTADRLPLDWEQGDPYTAIIQRNHFDAGGKRGTP